MIITEKNTTVATRMAASLGSMNAFDPETDNWSAYVERLESFFTANEIKDEKKVSVLVTFLGAKAYELLQNIIAPAKPANQSYDDLITAMKDHLDPKLLTIAGHFRFHQQNQKEGETIAQYLAELRRLLQHCEFADKLDETLRDRLVCGMQSGQIQKRLLAEKELTLKKVIQLSQGMEVTMKQSSELRMSGGAAVSGSQEIHWTTSGKPCYRCGKRSPTREMFKNAITAARQVTLLKYTRHPRNRMTRKLQPKILALKQKCQRQTILWNIQSLRTVTLACSQ